MQQLSAAAPQLLIPGPLVESQLTADVVVPLQSPSLHTPVAHVDGCPHWPSDPQTSTRLELGHCRAPGVQAIDPLELDEPAKLLEPADPLEPDRPAKLLDPVPPDAPVELDVETLAFDAPDIVEFGSPGFTSELEPAPFDSPPSTPTATRPPQAVAQSIPRTPAATPRIPRLPGCVVRLGNIVEPPPLA